MANSGVPCVPCVPDSLEALYYGAFRGGTPNANNRNTSCAEHVWCPAIGAPVRGKGITTGSGDAVNQAAISCSIDIAPAFSVIVFWLMDRGPSGVCNGTYTSMRELVRPNAFSVACRCAAMAANS